MKTSLKILILLVALATLPACSAQRRAERHIRKAVALCPELVQAKAHTIDTVLIAPAFADYAILPLPKVLQGDTVYAATEHGTVVVSLRQSDSALRVGFVAAPREIHYQDTVHYAQVAYTDAPQRREKGSWTNFFVWISGIGLGTALCFYFTKRKK